MGIYRTVVDQIHISDSTKNSNYLDYMLKIHQY